jgi:hypothetical protein
MRLAEIIDVNHDAGIAHTRWMDQNTDDGPDIPIPHPYPGRNGEGIYIGMRPGNVVVLNMLSYERYVPVSVLPIPGMYGDLTSTDESNFDDANIPFMESGDIVLQGSNAGQIRLDNNGDISLSNTFEEGIVYSGDLDDASRCMISTDSPVKYIISSSGLHASGIVRRDVRIDEEEESFADFLTDVTSEQMLEEIGWDVTKQVVYVTRSPTSDGTSKVDNKRFRNPAYVEDRQIIFEFGRDWDVGNFQDELNRLQSDLIAINEPDERRERRSNTLSLSLTHPNELIEKVSGTLIDVFGNPLGINKNILDTPEGSNPPILLENIFEISRHTVAYHMEINTRKGIAYRDGNAYNEEHTPTAKPITLQYAPKTNISANNARDRSRWSFRVDKEGLTTLNIPATSETGNIPLLTRQETSSVLDIDDAGNVKGERTTNEETSYLYKNAKNQDIYHDQFGPGGISIKGPSYNQIDNRLEGEKTSWVDSSQAELPKYVEAGTAFHNITQTALDLLQKNINKNASDIFDETDPNPDLPAVSLEIDSRISKSTSPATRDQTTGVSIDQPNAGGRSVQMNLDGSLETSIGANTIDRVSWVLDTAGAIITRIGRDRLGRSAIIQADGSVAVEIGGYDFIGERSNDEVDTRFVGRGESRSRTLPGDPKRYKSGKMVIRLRKANSDSSGPHKDGADDTLLIIDETGISLQTPGKFNLISSEDMVFLSGSRIVMEAPIVQVHEDSPKFFKRDGRNT